MPVNSMGQERGEALRLRCKSDSQSPRTGHRGRRTRSGAGDGEDRGEGKLLDQFNIDNPYAHYTTTGPENLAANRRAHYPFVSSMGTTGTITGVSRLCRTIQTVSIVGLQPEEGSRYSGIRRWPAEYLRGISTLCWMRCWIFISAMRKTPCANWRWEGIFCGVSSGGYRSTAGGKS